MPHRDGGRRDKRQRAIEPPGAAGSAARAWQSCGPGHCLGAIAGRLTGPGCQGNPKDGWRRQGPAGPATAQRRLVKSTCCCSGGEFG